MTDREWYEDHRSPRRQRIVVVTTSFPRNTDDPAGHFVESSALALAEEGHDVHVICAGRGSRRPPEARGRLTLHWAGGGRLFAWPGSLARLGEAPWRALDLLPYASAVRRRLGQIGPIDRAEAHWIVPSAWPLLASCPAPLTAIAHGADVRLLCSMPALLRHGIINRLLARSVGFRFVAHDLKRQLVAQLAPQQAAAVTRLSTVQPCPVIIPPSVHTTPAARDATRCGLACEPSEPLVVVASRLVAGKGVDLALRATARLLHPPRLVILGDGPQRSELEQLARELGVPATFAGQTPRTACLRTIAAADVVLHCSTIEAAPSVIREARACGVPVVATAAGDVKCWAERDTGIVVASPHPAAVATALEPLLKRRNAAPCLQNRGSRGNTGSC